MKWTTLTFKELAAQKTLRMDAGYWIKNKERQRRAASLKRQAASGKLLPQLESIIKNRKV